ncbi:MAG: DUF4238 domain-containing protein [Sphingobium sp.]|uniref:DUF4238 domain-containing protein n=1 Tax=Sphingobium sp. CECT 9361 TaxID=2845384 RepID=UPI001E5AC21F|nr:DUF4238 domain-containing protein [Sphingobium sp. CECT 9361]CAH0356815.1 hypothetical protein SPH9361_04458 [Sphingobium sp. CECT 9361]
MADNEPKRHHYVPQFYLRRFACADDANKVNVLERHGDVLVADRKSIGSIGYEGGLHDFVEDGIAGSIEGEINKVIETPFAASRTWKKIENGDCASLVASDSLPIYGFARHLQRRNLATLRFIETENARFVAGELTECTAEERAMHERLAATPGGIHHLFREAVLDTMPPEDADAINIMVCQSRIVLRTSTNPAVVISASGRKSVFGEMFNSLRTWWLTLDRHWGAFVIAGGPAGFTCNMFPEDAARVINRQYLTQMLHGDARYLLADDPFLESDLEWAGFKFESRSTHGFRYHTNKCKYPSPETVG